MRWRCGAYCFEDAPLIFGVLNVTPDSFSDGGEHDDLDAALAHAERLLAEGAHIIDVGGESTRPGANPVTPDEELARVLPVVRELARRGICVSVDTRHSEVAESCIEAGASIINDVSGFRDSAMRRVAAASDCGVVVMHMKGEPATMQRDTGYGDVVAEVGEYLRAQAALLEQEGIARERIMVDPGPGFGKTPADSHRLFAELPKLVALGYPVMAAVSRKTFIGASCGIDDPQGRDEASALCAAAAAADGAFAIRAHNVVITVDALARSKRAFIALGSNIGDGPGQLDAALASLGRMPGIWVTRVSGYYTSEPAYKEDQAAFTNAVAELRTVLGPYELLDVLHAVENGQGRERHEANGPRTLDLDILDYEGVVSDDPVLTLPHPRLLERDFTVTPLLEIAPGCVLADGTAVTAAGVVCGACVERLA